MKSALRIFGTVLVVLSVLTVAFLDIPQFAGFHYYNVISGSMEPTIHVNSLIMVKPVNSDEIEVDDIITFAANGQIITHRVIDIDGYTFITKGDANEQQDMNPIPADKVLGIVVFKLSYVGSLFQAISTTTGKIFLFGLFITGLFLEKVGDGNTKPTSKKEQ